MNYVKYFIPHNYSHHTTTTLISIFIHDCIDGAVSFPDWEKLNFMEVNQGQSINKPREKITSIEEMLKIIR